MSSVQHRTLALAGIYQSSELVIQLAWKGAATPDALTASVGSLFRFDVDHYADVYGEPHGLTLGLETVRGVLERKPLPHAGERTRYAVNVIYLARQLNRRHEPAQRLRSGLEHAARQATMFSTTHANVLAAVADLYKETVVPLGPRIIVHGEQSILDTQEHANAIRTVLLAGIRAATLWQQARGGRWRLLLERQAILREIDSLLTPV